MSSNPGPPDGFEVDTAILCCVSAIAEGLTKTQYLESIPARLLGSAGDFFEMIDPYDQSRVALLFARQIWNNCPIPSAEYRLDPIPVPNRNDRCSCGSGKKYKQCCRNLPPMPFKDLPLWPFLLELLSDRQLKDALSSKQIPIEYYGEIGVEWLEDGKPAKVVKLLSPLFESGRNIDPRLGYAMNVLCDAFEQLGHLQKKKQFLERITSEKNGVSGDAWQRIVTVRLDEDDIKGATTAFGEAMRSNPDDPSLAALEVMLMVRQGKDDDHIRARVTFWKQKLRRWGIDDGPIVSLLNDAETDPQMAFVSGIEDALEPSLVAFGQWVKEILIPREIPSYTIEPMRPFAEADSPPEDSPAEADLERTKEGMLETPQALWEIETLWRDVFTEDKPFSTQLPGDNETWMQSDWLAFLQQHPQAVDSLSILDDLVGIIEGFPQIDWIGVAEEMLDPIYDRARKILIQAMESSQEDITLAWPFTENRPALRMLYQRAMRQGRGDIDREMLDFEELIRINPNDNHGVRALLINHYLRVQQNQKAIDLADAYPDDMLVDLTFGKVLALCRMGHLGEAEALLRKTHFARPRIAPALWRKRFKQPELNSFGVTMGGEDEAWFYREDMRDEWLITPYAMDLVRKMPKK